MSIKKIFKDTYMHIKMIEKNTKILELLKASIEIPSQNESISSLQRDFLIIEVTYAYQHFGFSIFAKTSLDLIISELHRLCGAKTSFISNWLAITSDLILQDISIERKESLFENDTLENAFSHEFIKRIFCSEQEEDYLTGMGIFPKELIENIRTVSRKKITKITAKEEALFNDTIFEQNEFFLDDYPKIKNALFEFLYQLQSDPLSLLSWRLESFVSFAEKQEGSVFILREINLEKKIESKKIMAVVSLLIPHSDENGNLLLPHSPLTVNQISRLFLPDFKSERFQIDILKNWINPQTGDGLKRDIELLLETGVEYGLFFKVPNGQKGFSYGLSDNGLKIIRPFHSVLTDTILKNPIDLI